MFRLPANRWTAVPRQILGWSFSSFYIPGMVLTCATLSNERRAKLGPRLVRGWGLVMAGLAGVGVRFTERAERVLGERKPRVLTFNHSSTLDLLTGAALLPEGGVLVVKSEIKDMPLLGVACTAVGSVFLERGDRERAYAALQKVGQRIRDERLQVLIAPEGTRSKDGSLGRFKLGAFRLAQLAEVEIVPVVLHNHATLWPRGQLAPNGGVAVIDVLDPVIVPPEADLATAAEALRERYLEALNAGSPFEGEA